ADHELYPLSLHDALPIFNSVAAPVLAGAIGIAQVWGLVRVMNGGRRNGRQGELVRVALRAGGLATNQSQRNHHQVSSYSFHKCADRKSTRLNSSHLGISY